MKRILTTLCALAIVMAGAVPARAAAAPEGHYYPIEVKEYMEGDSPRISKTYQLSLSDDPSAIPTDDFERDGRLYYLMDMTRKDEVGVDTKLYTQTVTQASDTNDMEQILARLEGTLETATEDGYTGTLHLDHTTVKVTTDGYTTQSQSLSATRTYPSLSDADLSLIPKSIQDNGVTLALDDVQWSNSGDGHYTATASYTGTASHRRVTGYTVTADYTGQVAKTNCSVVTYTAVFGSVEQPKESGQPNGETGGNRQEEAASPIPWKRVLIMGGAALVLVGGGVFIVKKFKERK